MLTHQNKRDELCSLNLREIGGISFTQREIDVLACIVVHNRSEKMIASILSVSPRTIGTHTSNIMKKLGNSTRENIQNIAKKSGKLAYIREYYVHLRVYSMFIKVLQYVGKNLIRQNLNLIVNGSVSKESACNELKKYLEIANINLEFSGNKSKTSYQVVAVYDSNKSEKEAIYLQFEEHISDDEKHNEYVNLYDPDVFYFSVLKLVKFFVDSPRLNKYIDDFHAEYKSIISLSIAMPEISDLQSKDVVSTRGIVQFSTVIFLVLVFIFFCNLHKFYDRLVTITFWSFRIMVGIGFAMIFTGLVAVILFFRKKLFETKWFQYWCMAMTPSGFIALLAGWFVTEVGRQPYVAYGIIRTSEGVSPVISEQIAITLLLFIITYLFVFGAGSFYIIKLIRKGPQIANDDEEFYSHSIEASITKKLTTRRVEE